MSSKILTASWFIFVALISITYLACTTEWLFVIGQKQARENAELIDLDHVVFDGTHEVGTLRSGSTHS